jgi:flavin-dependent dehydrogenase
MRRDPVIIGAGPAGTAAAIVLARAGHRPILIERTAGPTDKVCGDFLSQDTIKRAQLLGVDPTALGAASIHRVRLIHGERAVDHALPFPALGLSRRVLDSALMCQAAKAGVILNTGQTVRRLTHDGNQWSIQTDTILTAETVFLATGKHDLRDAPRPHTGPDAVGMKMYFELAPEPAKALDGTIELTLFPGGYAGMQAVEAGKTVLCIAAERAAFRDYGGGWDALIDAIKRSSSRFGRMLAGARPLLPRPLAVAGIPYGYRASPGNLFRLGDQAAVIPSLTGDGIAIALHSGQQAAEAWLGAVDAATYQQTLTRGLASQMRLALLLHGAGMSRLTQTAAIPLARLFPSLLRHAASRTRVRTKPESRPIPLPPSGSPNRHHGTMRSLSVKTTQP